MRGKKLSIGLRATLAIVSLTFLWVGIASGEERVLNKFGSDGNGAAPLASLIWDAAGNLYGTTACASFENQTCVGDGVVFQLTPTVGGHWSEQVLHSFSGPDGATPQGSLIWDVAGNLYGTTSGGGNYSAGTVFELSPNGSGGWTYKKLHNFGISDKDGAGPQAGLIFDAAGNLYGTTMHGGNYGGGTIFELTPRQGGGWTEKKLHNFGNGMDGTAPSAGLIFDAAGNLYGTTTQGGVYSCGGQGCGMAFEMTPQQGGRWTEETLHNFGNGMDGTAPSAGLIFDAAGNLYGTTTQGGTLGAGMVFEMTPNQGGGWMEITLHNFGNGMDGTAPSAGLIFDAAGNLYGTTTQGGTLGAGMVFEMTPKQSGGWTETTLHNFGNGMDGTAPSAGLIFDAAGNLYGTTSGDSAHGPGTVFEVMACITPPSNMIAWYSFDQTGSVQDDLAKGNTATAHGTSSISGRVSNALLFDGTSAYAEAPEQSWLDIGTDNLSMAAWVKIAHSGDDEGIVVLFDKRDGPEQGYCFFLWPERRIGVQLGIHGDFTNYISNTTVPADNRWHLVAITVVRNSHTGGVWYLDGAPVERPFDPTRYQSSLLNSAAPLEIGVRESGELGGGGYFKGGLDELQIFNRALSPAEVLSLYLAGSAGTCKR